VVDSKPVLKFCCSMCCSGERWTAAYRRWRFGERSADIAKKTGHLIPPSLARDRYEDRMAWLTHRLVAAANVDFIVQRRRANWAALQQRLAQVPGYLPVFDRLPAGACPLFLPVYVADRSRLIMELESSGIEIFVFGAYAHPALETSLFPETNIMRDMILCLPVQQELGEPEVDIVASAVLPLLLSWLRVAHLPAEPLMFFFQKRSLMIAKLHCSTTLGPPMSS
jgi:DegT/DnrJ/EryC1/StrS aminotransferase family